MEKDIFKKIQEIEDWYKKMKQILIGFVSIVLIGGFCLGFIIINKFDLIRMKGIIIEDENGKDRILIGVFIFYLKDRVRMDINLVRKYFVSEFNLKNKDKYMEWYKNYRYLVFGMVVMNEKGIDVI